MSMDRNPPRTPIRPLLLIATAMLLGVTYALRSTDDGRDAPVPSLSIADAPDQKEDEEPGPTPTATDEPLADRSIVREILLDPVSNPVAIRGRIVDDRGDPIAGARVRWRHGDETGAIVTTSPPDGSFQIESAPRDQDLCLDASAISDAGMPLRRWYVPSVRVPPSGACDLGAIPMCRPARAHGVVVDESGVSISGAVVERCDADQPEVVVADERGRFEYLTEDFSARALLVPRANGFVATPKEDQTVEFHPGSEARDLTLTMKRSPILRGRVVDPSGAPIADAEISSSYSPDHEGDDGEGASENFLDGSGWIAARTRSDALGEFAIEALREPGWTITAAHPHRRSGSIEAAASGAITISLALRRSLVVVPLDVVSRDPIDTDRIRVRLTKDGSGSRFDLDRVRHAEGNDWTLRLDFDRPEPFDLTLEIPGFAPSRISGLKNASFDGGRREIEFERGAIVEGTVRRSDDHASVTNAWVYGIMSGPDGRREHVSTTRIEPNGAFRMVDLPRVPLSIEASVDGSHGTSAVVDVDLRSNESARVELVLPPRCGVEGRVQNWDPSCAGGVWVCAKRDTRLQWLVAIDAEGRFRVENLAPGDYDLCLATHGDRSDSIERARIRRVLVEGDRFTHVDFDLKDVPLAFVEGLARIDARPAIGTSISIHRLGSGYDTSEAQAVVDTTGSFGSLVLCAGDYDVLLTPLHDDRFLDGIRLRLVPGERRRIDFDIVTATLRGRLLSASGDGPIADYATRRSITLALIRRPSSFAPGEPWELPTFLARRAGSNGTFEFRGVASGDYWLEIDSSDDRLASDRVRVSIAPGGVTEFDLHLSRAARLEIEFATPPDETTRPRLELHAERDDGARWSCHVHRVPSGRYSIDPALPPGKFQARFGVEDETQVFRENATLDFELRPGTTTKITIPNP